MVAIEEIIQSRRPALTDLVEMVDSHFQPTRAEEDEDVWDNTYWANEIAWDNGGE